MTTRTERRTLAHDGETYLAACGTLRDRVTDHHLVETLHSATRARLIADTTDIRCSEVWWTTHYGRSAAERFTAICAMCADPTPDADVLDTLGDPRSILVVAWCIVTRPGATT